MPRFLRAQSSVETVLVIGAVAAALGVFFTFVRASVSSRIKMGADGLGHGLLYGKEQCSAGQRMCFTVTILAKFGGDFWDKDMPDLCGRGSGEDPCDPQNHCFSNDREDRMSAPCGTFTGFGASQGAARTQAMTQVTAVCGTGYSGGCVNRSQNACAWAGRVYCGVNCTNRQRGPTGQLCIAPPQTSQACGAC